MEISLGRAKHEHDTRLYSFMWTPLSLMGYFGLGIGLHFTFLRACAILCLIAGLINIPNILYFFSPEYSNSQPNVKYYLKGSAICIEQHW